MSRPSADLPAMSPENRLRLNQETLLLTVSRALHCRKACARLIRKINRQNVNGLISDNEVTRCYKAAAILLKATDEQVSENFPDYQKKRFFRTTTVPVSEPKAPISIERLKKLLAAISKASAPKKNAEEGLPQISEIEVSEDEVDEIFNALGDIRMTLEELTFYVIRSPELKGTPSFIADLSQVQTLFNELEKRMVGIELEISEGSLDGFSINDKTDFYSSKAEINQICERLTRLSGLEESTEHSISSDDDYGGEPGPSSP